MVLNKANFAIDVWETTILLTFVHAQEYVVSMDSTQNRESSTTIKVDTQSNNSGEQKARPATRQQSKKTEHGQTMHVTKQYRLTEEMVLRIIPVVLKKRNRKMVVHALLDYGNKITCVNEDVAAKLRSKEAAQQLQVNVLNGHSDTLETMPVQMELQSLDGNTKAKINAYTTN